MQASVLEKFGGPETLVVREVPEPRAPAGWVTVELRAAALNWHDVLVRQGVYDTELPQILGADGAGVRRDTGEDVVILPSLWWGESEAAPGRDWQILGDHVDGTYAEVTVVPEECVAPKPPGMGWPQAAALPLVGLTAYRALVTRGRLRTGEHVLILGAGGGLSSMAVSLAAGIGATVVVTSSSTWKIDQARASGAVGGVLYTQPSWPDDVRSWTPDGRGFDLVLDSIGSTWADSVRTLRPGGRTVVVGATGGTEALMPVRPFYFGQYDLLGSTMGSPRDFAGLLDLVEGIPGFAPTVHDVLPLSRVADAHRALEAGDHFGKVVLVPDARLEE